jgi:cytochrome c peroxidase
MSRILTGACGLAVVLVLILFLALHHGNAADIHQSWTEDDLRTMQHLRFSAESLAGKNSSNELLYRADAIELGRQLFHDTGMSRSGEVACATCHRPDAGYQDTQGITFKLDPDAQHRAPGLLGVALLDWFFWDGRADSLWSQALVPIETPTEHGTTRLQAVRHLCAQYGSRFPELLADCQRVKLPDVPVHASPRMTTGAATEVTTGVENENWQQLSASQQAGINRLFVRLGKSIAAFEAGLLPGVSRFDLYVDAISAGKHTEAASLLNDKEVAGLKLFLDAQVGCINCHFGPMFTNSGFSAVATDSPGLPEHDRQRGVKLLLDSEFNCLKWHPSQDCPKLRYVKKEGVEVVGAYKVPSLRNLRHAPAFMHDGRFQNLEAVIEHYQRPAILPLRHIDIRPAALLPHQRGQLLSFLNVLATDVRLQEIR